MNHSKTYMFDLDNNLFKTQTPVTIELRDGLVWNAKTINFQEFDKEYFHKILQKNPSVRLMNNEVTQAFEDFYDHGPRGDKAFSQDVLEAYHSQRTAPSFASLQQALSSASIFALNTSRGHNIETIKNTIKELLYHELIGDVQEQFLENCSKNYKNVPQQFESLLDRYVDMQKYYAVNSPWFYSQFGVSKTDVTITKKKLAIRDFLRYLKHEAMFRYQTPPSKISIGFSDDEITTVLGIWDYLSELSLDSTYDNFHFAVYHAADWQLNKIPITLKHTN